MFIAENSFAVLVAFLLATLAPNAASAADIAQREASAPSSGFLIVVVKGQAVTIPQEALTIELVEANDNRCPTEVTCIWAGHATVSLRVAKSGIAGEMVVLGTNAPPGMKLAHDAKYAGYLLHLESLEPARSAVASKSSDVVQASVRVSRQ
ncbi:MAG: hypothetical protein V4568_14120 [Pseudomonadota bacterium]